MSTTGAASTQIIDLSGPWRVELDRHDVGEREGWFSRALQGEILLPGSLEQARIGDAITTETRWTGSIFDKRYYTESQYAPYREPGNIKVPFWLQPETRYVGAAWYQRSITVADELCDRHLTLFLERAHWTTTVWLNDEKIGASDANSVAQTFVFPWRIRPGTHRLTVRVDNRLNPDIGENSHSVSDHTQGNWNGIVGRIELQARPAVWIEQLKVTGRVSDRVALVFGRLIRSGMETWPGQVTLTAGDRDQTIQVPVNADGTFQAELPFPKDAALWDEFHPQTHLVCASLSNGSESKVRFGFREVRASGRQLTLNGRKLFLRGTLDCAIFPKTGHPPTDVASWRRILAGIKAHGLNHVRYHSWCPPEAAFVAADEIGMYLQVEVASWPNWSTTLGDGKPVDAWIDAESKRILDAYGNHPSFIILCAGNEPSGPHHAPWLSAWVTRQKAYDNRRLYAAAAGWPQVPENDLHIPWEPRIQHWGAGLASRINARPPETRTDYVDYVFQRTTPVVSHEIGQWCVYPNFAEMPKYTGYLKPRNFEVFQESLEKKGMFSQAADFVHASGKLQSLCYKEDIEAALRTPEMGGFQLLGLQDFPGQGTALVGVLDPFWEEKSYITPAAFRRFSDSTVPLARLDKRVFTQDEHLTAQIDVSHFGPSALKDQKVTWRLIGKDDHISAIGVFQAKDIPVGSPTCVGRIDLALREIPAPAKYRLEVTLDNTHFANEWDVWVYPRSTAQTTAPSTVKVVANLDDSAIHALEAGETVWWMAGKSQASETAKGVALGFSSIFWNTAWTNGQAPHTLGILCDPTHPALAQFPTEAHSNWQWWYPISEAAPMVLDDLPQHLRPIVQVIDDWVTNRKLALVFEARVGRGKLLVSSITLDDASLDPVRRQLRASLAGYISSAAFQPSVDVEVADLRHLLAPKPGL